MSGTPAPSPPVDAAEDFALSIVVRATGAADALTLTFSALRAQTMPRWELIVVDDRNAGIPSTIHPWLLFLDAGETIHPTMLARVRDALAAESTLDAAHCGWGVLDDSGRTLVEDRCESDGDLFDLFARRCAFPLHACVVRRSFVEAIGGFDPSMLHGEDWLFLQRIARRGARFGRVADTLAYRSRGASTGAPDVETLLDAALRIIALGHTSDPAAGLAPDAPYFAGRIASSDPVVLDALCWTAGGQLARGDDAIALLAHLPDGHPVGDVTAAAERIVQAAPRALALPPDGWRDLWDDVRPRLETFLVGLEARVRRPGVARAIAAEVQRRVLAHLASLPVPVAGTSIAALEVTAPIVDVRVGTDVERVHFVVSLEGAVLGVMELCSTEGCVDAAAIRDAVADRFGWPILGRFFERTLHTDPARHDTDGWSTLLSQLWSPDPPPVARASRMIDRAAAWFRRGDDGRSHGMPRRLIVEAGARVPPLLLGRRNIDVELRVAGVRVASAEIAVGRAGVTTGTALRAALADAAGVALCRVVVREALLGAPFDGTTSLRERIERARARRSTPS